MDEATFIAVKERLEELSVVDHNGYNESKRRPSRSSWRSRLYHLLGLQMTPETLIFDMGSYIFSTTQSIPLLRKKTIGPLDKSPTLMRNLTMGSRYTLAPPHGILARGHHRDNPSPVSEHNDANKDELRLYQVLAKSLIGRALAFGSKVELKPEWVPMDKPFFSAPGTMEAMRPRSEANQMVNPCGGLLPLVTFVFVSLEGGNLHSSKCRSESKRVNAILVTLFQSVLSEMPGGYICRVMEGELKYMLAFDSPASALIFCIEVQEISKYAEWVSLAFMLPMNHSS